MFLWVIKLNCVHVEIFLWEKVKCLPYMLHCIHFEKVHAYSYQPSLTQNTGSFCPCDPFPTLSSSPQLEEPLPFWKVHSGTQCSPPLLLLPEGSKKRLHQKKMPVSPLGWGSLPTDPPVSCPINKATCFCKVVQ